MHIVKRKIAPSVVEKAKISTGGAGPGVLAFWAVLPSVKCYHSTRGRTTGQRVCSMDDRNSNLPLCFTKIITAHCYHHVIATTFDLHKSAITWRLRNSLELWSCSTEAMSRRMSWKTFSISCRTVTNINRRDIALLKHAEMRKFYMHRREGKGDLYWRCSWDRGEREIWQTLKIETVRYWT